jgi:hypothetical protein
MRPNATIVDSFIRTGLVRLQKEAFAEDGLGYGAEEVVSTSVTRQAMGQRTEAVRRNGQWGFREFSRDFSYEAMDSWLLEVRRHLYVLGEGAWVTYRVHLFPDADGRLEVFDEEIFPLDGNGKPDEGSYPATAAELRSELVAFPRTVDNIPDWMWGRFRAEGVTPPVYNPELKTVDWDNRRLPVTDAGTDFSAEPVVIDPSKEPGFFSKIGRKLFGS